MLHRPEHGSGRHPAAARGEAREPGRLRHGADPAGAGAEALRALVERAARTADAAPLPGFRLAGQAPARGQSQVDTAKGRLSRPPLGQGGGRERRAARRSGAQDRESPSLPHRGSAGLLARDERAGALGRRGRVRHHEAVGTDRDAACGTQELLQESQIRYGARRGPHAASRSAGGSGAADRRFPRRMTQFLSVHPTHPQKRLIRLAAEAVKRGGLIAYPTDSCYALGCDLGATTALERLRRIRGVDERHRLTLMCRDLSEISAYATVDDARFRLLKSATPGSYTFILPARRQVPRRATSRKTIGVRAPPRPRVPGGGTSRKTIGVRMPGHPAAHALLAELDAPMLSATLTVAGDEAPLADAEEIRARLESALDVIVDGGPCGVEPSTVID